MNDFTKADIINIYDLVKFECDNSTQPECMHNLMEKLRHMIDSYCEHEFTIPQKNVIDFMAGAIVCSKCNIKIHGQDVRIRGFIDDNQ